MLMMGERVCGGSIRIAIASEGLLIAALHQEMQAAWDDVAGEEAPQYYIDAAEKDPEAGNHNYLNLSGHYGRGKSRNAKSVGKSRRGFNNIKHRVRQTN